jgi:hypothetical protein
MESVVVNDVILEELIYRDKRVVTFEMVAKVNNTPEKTVRNAYARNAQYFIEGVHTYLIQGEELQSLKNGARLEGTVNSLRVFTEIGYYLLIKPMRDPTSWRVQGEMAESYFRINHDLIAAPYRTANRFEDAEATLSLYAKLGAFFQTPDHIVMIEAKKELGKLGIDASPFLLASPSMNYIPLQDEYLEPTELGRRWNLSAADMNKTLAQIGLQARVNKEWVPTDGADGMYMKHAWSVKSKSGYNLKWNVAKVESLMNKFQLGTLSDDFYSDDQVEG